MVSGHRPHAFERLLRLSAVALAGTSLAACSIGLSASAFDSASPYDAGGYDVRLNDASARDSSATVGDTSDAGAVIVTPTTNPLCNIDVQNDSGTCDPDYAIAPSGELCQVPDAGQAFDAGLLADGGIVDSGPPLGADAGILLACRVAVVTSGSVQSRIQTCGLGGTGGDGDSCQTGDDCAPSFECVGMPGRCRHYCCDGDKSCATSKSPSFCDIEATAASNITVPVCAPVSSCKLLTANACGTDQTCAVVKEDGTTSCVTVGPAQVGQDCNATHCGAGLTCLGKTGARQCFKLCRVGYPEDCADGAKSTTCTGSAQLFNDPDYGICQ